MYIIGLLYHLFSLLHYYIHYWNFIPFITRHPLSHYYYRRHNHVITPFPQPFQRFNAACRTTEIQWFVRSFQYSPETTGLRGKTSAWGDYLRGIRAARVWLYTLRPPASSAWLAKRRRRLRCGDCVAVVHDLGLHTVIKKVKGMRVFQWSVGAAGVLWGWTLQARGLQGQQQRVHLAEVVNQAGLQRRRAVMEEYSQQPLAPAVMDQPRYSHRRCCCNKHSFVEWWCAVTRRERMFFCGLGRSNRLKWTFFSRRPWPSAGTHSAAVDAWLNLECVPSLL